MADEQIRIDITAQDKASDQLDDVADAVDELEDVHPVIPVTADTAAATRELGDVADDAADLERLTPELTVSADADQATRAIADVGDEARELSGKDVEILLKAKIDDARGALKKLRSELDQTGDKADDTARHMDKIGGEGGLRTRGQAIADLTGPLGEASSAASDFAGVFDGIGDIAEDVAAKVGINAAAMTSAISGIGIAVAAGAALWSLFTANQKKAREEQRKLVEGQEEINQAIADGDRLAAASKISDLYSDAFAAADQLGIKTQDVTRYLTGQTDQIGLTADEYKKLDAQTMVLYDQLVGRIEKSRKKYEDSNGTLRETNDRTKDIAEGLAGVSDQSGRTADDVKADASAMSAAMDGFRGKLNMQSAFLRFEADITKAMTTTQSGAINSAEDILSIKQSILDVAEFAKLTPVEVSSLLERVDRGDLVSVRQDVEGYYRGDPAGVATRLFPVSNVGEFVRVTRQQVGTIPIETTLRPPGNSGVIYGQIGRW